MGFNPAPSVSFLPSWFFFCILLHICLCISLNPLPGSDSPSLLGSAALCQPRASAFFEYICIDIDICCSRGGRTSVKYVECSNLNHSYHSYLVKSKTTQNCTSMEHLVCLQPGVAKVSGEILRCSARARRYSTASAVLETGFAVFGKTSNMYLLNPKLKISTE